MKPEEMIMICKVKMVKVTCEREKLRWELGHNVARTLMDTLGVKPYRDTMITLFGIGVEINMFDPWCIKLWEEVE